MTRQQFIAHVLERHTPGEMTILVFPHGQLKRPETVMKWQLPAPLVVRGVTTGQEYDRVVVGER